MTYVNRKKLNLKIQTKKKRILFCALFMLKRWTSSLRDCVFIEIEIQMTSKHNHNHKCVMCANAMNERQAVYISMYCSSLRARTHNRVSEADGVGFMS